jgi:hypothetical protein
MSICFLCLLSSSWRCFSNYCILSIVLRDPWFYLPLCSYVICTWWWSLLNFIFLWQKNFLRQTFLWGKLLLVFPVTYHDIVMIKLAMLYVVQIASSIKFSETHNFFASSYVFGYGLCKISFSCDKNVSSVWLLILYTRPAMFQSVDCTVDTDTNMDMDKDINSKMVMDIDTDMTLTWTWTWALEFCGSM